MHLILAAALLTITPPDTVVVCPTAYTSALSEWIEHRSEQGRRVAMVSSDQSADAIRSEIQRIALGGELKFVVLVGDVNSSQSQAVTPTHFVKARVNVRWGSEPEIATDNRFADLDNDAIPDVAVGRLPADSPEELTRLIRKTLAYEKSGEFGLWRRRVSVVAGVGGFGSLVDNVIEMAAKNFIADGIPPEYNASMTYGSWRSPYCPDPRRFKQAALARHNQGCLFWVYIGHGQRRHLDVIRVPGGRFSILSTADSQRLRAERTPPIALMLACYTGAFDGEEDCLAEEMLSASGGPVAVFGSSRVSMPYAMAVMAEGMLDAYFEHEHGTLGEVVLHAKQQLVKSESNTPNRHLLDMMAKAISPAPELLDEERREHLDLFNLLGDPLLKLPRPQVVEVLTESKTTAGEDLVVKCRSPIAGKCVVELAARRDRLTFTAPPRREFDASSASLAEYDDVYHKANDRRWAWVEVDAPRGEFEVTLDVPAEARGVSHVRCYVEGKEAFAAGHAKTQVFRRREK